MWIEFSENLGTTLLSTWIDVLSMIVLFMVFQILILKQTFKNPLRLFLGLLFVVFGLSLFLIGLEKALFPIGRIMVDQLVEGDFRESGFFADFPLLSYIWLFAFAGAMGFATTIAEPSLIAVANKASEASAGSISSWMLRIVVALGVAIALIVGTVRIITGFELYYIIVGGYLVTLVITHYTPKTIVGLAYDSGGVTTSTVTVPIVAALGITLSSKIPGRNPAIDGFGLIALASLFPILTVLSYGLVVKIRATLKHKKNEV
jgi:hypothetical protein